MRRRPDDAHRPPRGRSRARRAGPPVQRRLADAKWRPAASWAQCTRRLSAPDALAGRSLILAMRRRYSGASETGRGGSGPPSAAEVRYRAESPSIVPAVYPARSTVGGTVARDPHRCRGIGAAGSSLAISGVPISGAPVESKGGILNDVGIDSGIADMSERSMRTRPDRGYLRRIGLGNFFRASQAETLGITYDRLRRLEAAGEVERVARGLNRLADAEPTERYSLAAVCVRVPNPVVCLLSALEVHEIGSRAPLKSGWPFLTRRGRRGFPGSGSACSGSAVRPGRSRALRSPAIGCPTHWWVSSSLQDRWDNHDR